MPTATSITDAIGLLNNAPDGHGWTDRDARIGAKLAAKINLGVPLTHIETRSTWRKLDAEYRDRLTALGVTTLQAPPADTAPPTAPAPNTGEATVRVGIVGAGPKRRILTHTPYSFADKMKRIPGGEFHSPKRCRSCTAHKPCPYQAVSGWHYPPTNTAARAIAEATRGERTLTDPAFQALLADAETAVQSRALRSALDLPDIPGLKTTAWLHQKQAFQFAVAQDGCILDMDMGPVAGSSIVTVNRGGAGRRMRLDTLIEKLRTAVPGGIHKQAWDSNIPTRIRCLKADGRIGLATIVDWVDKGEQSTVCVAVDGKFVICTPDHEVVTRDRGKVAARDLIVGEHVLTDPGNPRRTTPRPDKAREPRKPGPLPGAARPGVSRDSHGYVWVYDPTHPNAGPGGQVLEHVKVMAEMLGRPLIHPECVHHKDFTTDNNDPNNLVLCADQAEHATYHDWRANLPGVIPESAPVKSVSEWAPESVYCVRVDDPAHTFIADGIVVSNTGKSLTAVGRIVAAVRKATIEKRRFAGIILCPERVVGVWPKQFRIHAEDEFHVVEGRRENRNGEHVFLTIAERVREFEYALHECPCGRPHVIMMNYAATIYEPFKAWSLRQSWDILVLDEIHKIKSPSGKWAQHAYKLGQRSAVRLGLTGTLMPHSPMDVFSQMRAVDAGVFGTTEGKFKHTYMEMGGFQGKVALGLLPEMEAAFAQQVSDHTYRVGSEVLDLPEAVPDVDLMCSLPKEQARVYRELESSLFSEIQVMLDNGKTLEAAVSADNVLVKMLRLQQITGGAVRLDDPEDEDEPEVDGEAFDPATGELLGRPARSRKPARMLVFQEQPKAKLLKDLLEDIDPGHPVVVFCKFRNDLDQVEAVASDMGRTYGELSGRRSDAVTRDSTLVPGVQIAGVQLQAGGTGIDFTASHYCVYYSLSHSLGDFLQSRKRLHRPGQESAVRFLHLVMDGTIDQAVYAALEARESVAKHVGALIRARQEAKA